MAHISNHKDGPLLLELSNTSMSWDLLTIANIVRKSIQMRPINIIGVWLKWKIGIKLITIFLVKKLPKRGGNNNKISSPWSGQPVIWLRLRRSNMRATQAGTRCGLQSLLTKCLMSNIIVSLPRHYDLLYSISDKWNKLKLFGVWWSYFESYINNVAPSLHIKVFPCCSQKGRKNQNILNTYDCWMVVLLVEVDGAEVRREVQRKVRFCLWPPVVLDNSLVDVKKYNNSATLCVAMEGKTLERNDNHLVIDGQCHQLGIQGSVKTTVKI